jgi:hypothetical protein
MTLSTFIASPHNVEAGEMDRIKDHQNTDQLQRLNV